LEQIIEQRVGHKGMGFHATVRSKSDKNPGELFAQVLPEDLLKFGMIPEFIGRLPMVGAVHALDKPALMQILTEPKNALVKQYGKIFEFDDVELDITPEALEAIADLALTRGTGARGLRALLEETLLDVMYEVPGRTDVAKVVVTAESVNNKVSPEIVTKTAARTPRQRRAAS
jgi:ATP-dependent Clp protease ATP-binding subunit ClpX